MVKIDKLTAFAEELGISFTFDCGVCVVNDRDAKLPKFFAEDLEGGEIDSFPFLFDFKVIYDNPDYLEAERKKQEEARIKYAEEQKVKAEAKAKKLEEEKRKEEMKLREAELKLLEKLKEKYKDGN